MSFVLFAGPMATMLSIPDASLPVFLAVYIGIQLGLPDSFRTGNNSTDAYVGAITMNAIYERRFAVKGPFDLRFLPNRPSPGVTNVDDPRGTPSVDGSVALPDGTIDQEGPRARRGGGRASRRAQHRPGANIFAERLLQSLRSAMTIDEIEALRREFGAREYERHIHKLLTWGLVEPVTSGEDVTGYVRTSLGEEGLNAVRELQRKVGEERARSIAEAGLGSNAIKLFLTVFGNPKEVDMTTREILYTPLEIGQLTRFFSRSVEGVSAVDKLDDAGLISYLEDGNVHVNPRRSTAFYHYLRNLYFLIARRT